jgi:hypothetical protein
MFTYFLLHGTYGKDTLHNSTIGIFWLFKDTIFPDASFQRKVTITSAGFAWLLILGPYLIPAYRLASGKVNNDAVIFERALVCMLLYMFGLVFMLLADS